MAGLRTFLFWLHLATGVTAGAVILVMCVTGVALTYEKQLLEWADARVGTGPAVGAAGATPLPVSRWVAFAVEAAPGRVPSAVTVRAQAGVPATVVFDRGGALLVDPGTGAVLGEPSPGLRRFFRTMTNWHRWLALEGASRQTARAVTGAANLGFLFTVLSGLYLWLPKVFTWAQVRQVLVFRRGLPAKARDFNWHNVLGVWSAVPLAVVVAGAVPISYGWAGALIYRLSGETPPPATRPAQGAGPSASSERPSVSLQGLDEALVAAQATVPRWRTATVRFTAESAPWTVAIDAGYAGQPQHRTTLTIDRATAQVTREERFTDFGPGRQWRSWFRFVHTGEYYGLAGQTVAGLVTAGGAVLVYTGVALSLRRFAAWRRRQDSPRPGRHAA